jgi:hypothetical protein
MAFIAMVAAGGCCMSVDCACLRGPRRLALLGICQCDAGLHRRTALAASASWGDLASSGPWRVAVTPAFLSYLNCISNHSLKNILNLFRRSSCRNPPPIFRHPDNRAVLFFCGATRPFSFSTGPAIPSHHHHVAVGRVRLPGRDRRCRARVPSFLFSYFV